MKPSQDCINIIKRFEGLKLKAYKCSAKVDTIGYGTTMYPDGSKVKPTDITTLEMAERYLQNDLERRAPNVLALVRQPLKQQQFDALVSFAYNLGIGALSKSTLLKKINVDPNDPTIALEFNKWVKADGKVLLGLQRRRKAESELYFK